MKEGVEVLNLRAANEFCVAVLFSTLESAAEDAAVDFSIPEGTKIGISLTFGDKVANLFVMLCTDGWKEGVFKLNFRFDSMDEASTVLVAGKCEAVFAVLASNDVSTPEAVLGVFLAIVPSSSEEAGNVFSDVGDRGFSELG